MDMEANTLDEIKQALFEFIGEVDLLNIDQVWERISTYKKWRIQKPSEFAIQGRLIESGDKKMVDFSSINIPGVDTLSFSFQKTYPRNNKGMSESYAFYLKYPEKILVLVADTFKPLAKIVSMIDGSVTMSSL